MAEKQHEFSFEEIIKRLKKIQKESIKDPNINDICFILTQFKKLLQKMGKLIEIGFKDVDAKVKILLEHQNYYNINGLFTLLNVEIKQNIAILNSENNKKYTKDPQLIRYESASRTMLRMMWFIDFLVYLFINLTENPNSKTSSCVSAAYSKAFGTKHSLIIRFAAKAAWLAAPERNYFYKIVKPDYCKDTDQKTMIKFMQDFNAEVEPIKNCLWDFYKQNNIDQLP